MKRRALTHITGTTIIALVAGMVIWGYMTTTVGAATITVGPRPGGVAFDSNKNEIFVANFGSSTVSVISDATNTVTANITVGTGPGGVAFDSNKNEIFVTNYGSGTVSVIPS